MKYIYLLLISSIILPSYLFCTLYKKGEEFPSLKELAALAYTNSLKDLPSPEQASEEVIQILKKYHITKENLIDITDEALKRFDKKRVVACKKYASSIPELRVNMQDIIKNQNSSAIDLAILKRKQFEESLKINHKDWAQSTIQIHLSQTTDDRISELRTNTKLNALHSILRNKSIVFMVTVAVVGLVSIITFIAVCSAQQC